MGKEIMEEKGKGDKEMTRLWPKGKQNESTKIEEKETKEDKIKRQQSGEKIRVIRIYI